VIPAALHLASVAGLWAAIQGTVAVSSSTRGSARSGFGSAGTTGYDLDETPIVALTLASGKTSLSLGYNPQLTVHDIFRPADRTVSTLHAAHAAFSFGGPGYQFTLSETGSIGTQSFTGLRTTALDPSAPVSPTTPQLDLLPSVQTVRTASLSSGASFDYEWTRRLRSSASASYAVSGGRGQEARAILPRQKTAGGSLSTDYLFTRADHVGGQLMLSNAITSGPDKHEYLTLTGTGNWSHEFQKGIAGQLTLGAYGTRALNPGLTPYYSVSSTGALSGSVDFVRRRGLVVSLAAGASVAPVINSLSGILQRRVQGTGTFRVQVDDLSATAGGDAAQTLPLSDHSATRIFGVSAGVGYSLAKFIILNADYRTARQSSRDRAADLQRQWTATVGVTLLAPPVKF
jgi:hypothetical protein